MTSRRIVLGLAATIRSISAKTRSLFFLLMFFFERVGVKKKNREEKKTRKLLGT